MKADMYEMKVTILQKLDKDKIFEQMKYRKELLYSILSILQRKREIQLVNQQ